MAGGSYSWTDVQSPSCVVSEGEGLSEGEEMEKQ